MAGISYALRQLDRQSIAYEAMAYRVGEGNARKAFARALNHEGAKANTVVKRQIRKQSSIRIREINKAITFVKAGKQTLRTIIRGTGAPIPLRYFGARQFKYGVRAKVWGRNQQFKGAFIIGKLGGNVFKNTRGWNKRAGRFNQIEKLYGPSVPKTQLMPTVVDAFMASSEEVAFRAYHELSRILNLPA